MLRLWDMSMLQEDPEGEVELSQQVSGLYGMSLNLKWCRLLLVAASSFAEIFAFSLCEVIGRMQDLEE